MTVKSNNVTAVVLCFEPYRSSWNSWQKSSPEAQCWWSEHEVWIVQMKIHVFLQGPFLLNIGNKIEKNEQPQLYLRETRVCKK